MFFADLQCPFCRKEYRELKPLEKSGRVALVFRHFPINAHRFAVLAANLSELAGERGKFWEYVDMCFTGQPKTAEDYKVFAVRLGVRRSDIDGIKTLAEIMLPRVQQDQALGQRLSISGVPVTLGLAPSRLQMQVVQLSDLP